MSENPERYHDIAGLEGKEPVGAVLTIGRKGPGGAPIETDRFFLVTIFENENGVRPLHPSFGAFNATGKLGEAELSRRQTIRGNLVHSTRSDAFDLSLSAQVLGKRWTPFPGIHPRRFPICSGDGRRATRYFGTKDDGSEDWRTIDCPNELCEFRQGETKACRPFARLYFRPKWADESPLPLPLAKFTTHSWNSARAILGFFDYVLAQAENLGIEEPSLYGLPFVLTLGRKKIPSRARSFPVVSMTTDGDLVDFFLAQKRRILEAGGRERLALPPATGALDLSENDPEEIERDHRAIVPTKPYSRPAEVASPDDEVVEGEVVEDVPETGPIVPDPGTKTEEVGSTPAILFDEAGQSALYAEPTEDEIAKAFEDVEREEESK